MTGLSELASRSSLREPLERTIDPYGLTVHTTGSGIVRQAIKLKKDPFRHTVDYYLTPKAEEDYYPHYVCGYDGTLIQVTDERRRAPHVGFAERPIFLQPDWDKKVPVEVARLWRRAWPTYPSPAYLLPGRSTNDAFVGIELLPIVDNNAEAAYPYSTFTQAQHQIVVLLARDLAERWRWPSGWEHSPRLLGHEDLNPITRSDKNGGWDPGALRAQPRFAWGWVRELCAGRDPGPISS